MTQNRPLMANRVFHVLVVAVIVVTFVWPSVSWGGDASPRSGVHNMTHPNEGAPSPARSDHGAASGSHKAARCGPHQWNDIKGVGYYKHH